MPGSPFVDLSIGSPVWRARIVGEAGLLVSLLLAIVLLGCQSSGDEAATQNAPYVVGVTASDYTYRGVPDSIPSGWTTLQLRNEGTETHHVGLARLHEGTSADTVAAWAHEYQAPAPADLLGGVFPRSAGQTAYLTVDLEPGRYAWVSHASKEKGMMKTFTVE